MMQLRQTSYHNDSVLASCGPIAPGVDAGLETDAQPRAASGPSDLAADTRLAAHRSSSQLTEQRGADGADGSVVFGEAGAAAERKTSQSKSPTPPTSCISPCSRGGGGPVARFAPCRREEHHSSAARRAPTAVKTEDGGPHRSGLLSLIGKHMRVETKPRLLRIRLCPCWLGVWTGHVSLALCESHSIGSASSSAERHELVFQVLELLSGHESPLCCPALLGNLPGYRL